VTFALFVTIVVTTAHLTAGRSDSSFDRVSQPPYVREQIKKRYDPDNLFPVNRNIRVAGS
jgi:hypothetical protein